MTDELLTAAWSGGGDGVDGALQGAVCEHGGGTNLQAVGPSRLLARAFFLLLLRRTGLLSVPGAEGMWDSCPRAALVRRFPQAGASCLCRTPMDPLPLYAMTISCILVSIFSFWPYKHLFLSFAMFPSANPAVAAVASSLSPLVSSAMPCLV